MFPKFVYLPSLTFPYFRYFTSPHFHYFSLTSSPSFAITSRISPFLILPSFPLLPLLSVSPRFRYFPFTYFTLHYPSLPQLAPLLLSFYSHHFPSPTHPDYPTNHLHTSNYFPSLRLFILFNFPSLHLLTLTLFPLLPRHSLAFISPFLISHNALPLTCPPFFHLNPTSPTYSFPHFSYFLTAYLRSFFLPLT